MKNIIFIILILSFFIGNSQQQSIYNGWRHSVPIGCSDADADAFITTTGISDPTIQDALKCLVSGYKTAGLWSKRKAIYPMVGGSSSTHSYNLKDVSQYQITWGGSVTHNSNGVTGDGSTGYGNTGLNASSVLTLNDFSFFFYCNNNSDDAGVEFGAEYPGGTILRSAMRFSGANDFSAMGNSFSSSTSPSNSANGFSCSRTGSGGYRTYSNGSVLANVTASSSALPNTSLYLLCQHVDGDPVPAIQYPSLKRCAGFAIGDGISDAEALAEYNLWQAFETAIGRNN